MNLAQPERTRVYVKTVKHPKPKEYKDYLKEAAERGDIVAKEAMLPTRYARYRLSKYDN